jgi:hypothetical protein
MLWTETKNSCALSAINIYFEARYEVVKVPVAKGPATVLVKTEHELTATQKPVKKVLIAKGPATGSVKTEHELTATQKLVK